MTTVELPFATVSFESPVVYYQYRPGTELGLQQLKEVIVLAEKLSWNRPYFTFSDVRGGMTVTQGARRYLANFSHLPFFRGAAVLVQSGMMSNAINFLSFFQKKKYPLRAFTDQKKALEWLTTLSLDDGTQQGWSLM
jgi:hypothetical protein